MALVSEEPADLTSSSLRWDVLLKELGLGANALPHLQAARQFSRTTIEMLREFADRVWKETGSSDSLALGLAGSFARHEAHTSSDIDPYCFCLDSQACAAAPRVIEKVREKLEETGYEVSRGEMFDGVVEPGDLLRDLGDATENKRNHTARVLLLSEIVPIHGRNLIDELRGKVLALYGRTGRTGGRYYLSVANDMARYWRTLCIDYIYKVEVLQEGWAIRNIKLRSYRKLWHFSNMMLFAAITGDAQEPDAVAKSLQVYAGLPPLAKIAHARRTLGPFEPAFLTTYDEIAGRVQQPAVRVELEALDYASRAENETYGSLRAATDRFQQQLTNLLLAHCDGEGWGGRVIRQFMF